MLRTIVNVLVWLPLAILFTVFAVANRHWVTVSFDPFNGTDPSVAISLPLFVVIILAAILGVVAGGTATWFRQGRWRRAARLHEADARDARARLEAHLAAMPASRSTGAASTVPTLPRRVGHG